MPAHGQDPAQQRPNVVVILTDDQETASFEAMPAYADVRAALQRRLEALRSCSGADCSRTPALGLRPRPGPQRPCLRRDVDVRLVGPASGEVSRLELRLGGQRLGIVTEPPFEDRLPLAALPARGSALLRATADLADGRRWTRVSRLRACA